MSRIRTIKPDFWTDEKVVQLPYEARLLFIGLWNFADDEGRLADEPGRIKLEVFPNDTLDVEAALDMLVACDLLERYRRPDGSSVLVIAGFTKHQKVSHPTPSRLSLERSRKIRITPEVRRAVAKKYGCEPGGDAICECYYCGAPGRLIWNKKADGSPSYWVSVTGGLEFDHFEPEASGGESACKNIVLACRACNRSKGHKEPDDFILLRRGEGNLSGRSVKAPEKSAAAPETSGALRPEGKGRESIGRESKPATRASAREDEPNPYRPDPRAVEVIAAFDDAVEQHFGKERRRPFVNPADHGTAIKWLEAGADVALCRGVFDAVCERMARGKRQPPGSLKYCDSPVTRALEERSAPMHVNGTAVADAAPMSLTDTWRDRLAFWTERKEPDGSWSMKTWPPSWDLRRDCPPGVIEEFRDGLRARPPPGVTIR